MELAGQGTPANRHVGHSRLDDRGYIMVVLLIGMAVAAVAMGATLPAWRQQATREKEEDLIFRGNQYARAIFLYYEKTHTLPNDIDVLVSQKYLRKKWKDPISGKDFTLIGGATQAAAPAGGTQAGGRGTGPAAGGQVTTGISGVYSPSTATSIKIYRNAQEYDQWLFQYTDMQALMRGAQGAAGGANGRAGGAPGRGGTNGRGNDGVNGRGGLNGRGTEQSPVGPNPGRGGPVTGRGRGGA